MTEKLREEQKKELVAKLKPLFHGLASEEVDEVVAEVKKQTTDTEMLEERRNGLGKLFDIQIETLKFRGCPKVILEMFQEKRDGVLSKVSGMEIPEGNIPFVPVIPRSYMGIYALLPMVRNKDKMGYTYLDPNEITDKVKVPQKPYFIYDVENGNNMLGKSPEATEKLIKKQERSCLITEEGIALCTHTDVLLKHYVDCTGSRYKRNGRVPLVYLNGDEPKLSSDVFVYSDDGWGSASCRSRG